MHLAYHDEGLMNRNISSFPLSIGTGLAFESLFTPSLTRYDPQRKIPEMVDLFQYDSMWINIKTLFRNAAASVTSEVFEKCTAKDLAGVMIEEMSVIEDLFATQSGAPIDVVFYDCDYESLKTKINSKIKMRLNQSKKQVFFEKQYKKTIEILTKYGQVKTTPPNLNPKTNQKKALIMSHYAWDLLSSGKFLKLDLLESNTGLLKSKLKWGSKYYPVPNNSIDLFPFTRKLLLLFGDNTLISPFDIRLRLQIVQIGKDKQWNPYTSLEKVNMDLTGGMTDRYMSEFIASL